MNYPDAVALAKKYDSKLTANDPRFRRSVLIAHEDGSIFRIDSAFLMQKGEWLFMFSEHHGFMVFVQEELLHYTELQRIYNPIEELQDG